MLTRNSHQGPDRLGGENVGHQQMPQPIVDLLRAILVEASSRVMISRKTKRKGLLSLASRYTYDELAFILQSDAFKVGSILAAVVRYYQ
jgi:hypothetical protein